MNQPHTDDGRRFGSHDEWADYWGRDLLADMNIKAPDLTCAMCGTPTANVSGFCSEACEAEHGERIDG